MKCKNCDEEFLRTRKNSKFCSTFCYQRFSTRKWRKDHPDKHAVIARRGALKRKYGISVEDYTQMFDEQFGKCKICRQSSMRSLDVDHDHETGAVRGLLCNKCNQAIGLLQDNPLIVQSAYEYLIGGVA